MKPKLLAAQKKRNNVAIFIPNQTESTIMCEKLLRTVGQVSCNRNVSHTVMLGLFYHVPGTMNNFQYIELLEEVMFPYTEEKNVLEIVV